MKLTSERRGISTTISVVLLIVGLAVGAAIGYGVTVISGVTSGNTGTGLNSPIKIGVLEPLSGPLAGPGQGIVDAIELAAAQVNASGGINGQPIKLFVDDVSTDPSTALSDLQNLYSVQGVQIVVGPPTTQQVLTIEQYATQNHIVVISSSATAGQLTNSSAYFFRTVPSDNLQTQAVAAYINAKGYSRVAIVTRNDAFGQGIATSLQSLLGSKVVTTIEVTSGQSDYTTQMDQVKAANPDVIFYDEFTADGIVIFKNALSLGLQNIPTVGSVEMEDPTFFSDSQAGQYMLETNLTGPSQVSTTNTAPYISFASAFQSKFGMAPGVFATNSYDATMIAINAIARAGVYDGAKIQAQVVPASLSYVGPSGYLGMNNQGDVTSVAYTFYHVTQVNSTSLGFATFGSYVPGGTISLSG
jgi:branched-chain amino acid transport system substrate-binding protein